MYRLAFIEDNMGALRKSEIKVAEYIIEQPGEVVYLSISELADRVGVSEPTVIRFCRGVGFKGFQDFKLNLAGSVIPEIQTIHEAVDGNEAVPDLVQKVFDSNINAVKSTLSTLDFRVLENSIRRITNSSKIVFFGLGGSAVVAMDAFHKFFRIGIPCEYFSDHHMAIMAASMLAKDDVFFAISHSGSSKPVRKSLEVAKDAGAFTIALVSHKRSPVSGAADATLCVASAETHYRFEPMSSMIAQMSVIDVISVGVSLNLRDTVVSNLNKARKALTSERY